MIFHNRKHHPKILPLVTPLCPQSHTTIHTKIHPYALVHKIPPRNPDILFSLHFIHMSIISTQTHFVTSFAKTIYTFLKTWQRHVTLLKTQDGDIPTARSALVNSLHWPLTHIVVQVLYTAIQNNLIPHNRHYLIHWLQSSLRIFKSGYPSLSIVINSIPSSCSLILFITPLYL